MHWNRKLIALLSGGVLALAACGGGGGGTPNPPDPAPVDVTPDKFTLKDVTNAEPDTYYTATMTVAGVNAPVKVRVCCASAAPEFSTDGGETWRKDSADVENGDEVMIRLKSKSEASGIVNALLYVGGTNSSADAEGTVSDNFQVVTAPDETAPELAVHFPPPYSLTDAPLPGVLRFRGTVSDESGVAGVTVNGVEAALNTDGTWNFDYEVLSGENTVSVIALDEAGNEVQETRVIVHAADRAELEFGTGSSPANPVAALWDAGRQRLLGGDVAQILDIDLSSGNRTHLSGAGGFGLDYDAQNDRYLSAAFAVAGGMAVSATDPETGAENLISARGDGLGQDADFRFPHDLAVTPDGRRIFARAANDAFTAAHLWLINSDPASAQFGNRQQFSDETFTENPGLASDANRNRILIGDCDLRSLPFDAEPGTLSNVVIPEAGDFCVCEIAAVGDTAWGRSRQDGNRIIAIDLVDDTYAHVSDLDDPSQGPTVGTIRQAPAVDAERGIYYLFLDGTNGVPDAMIAIDLQAGYRVIVSQVP